MKITDTGFVITKSCILFTQICIEYLHVALKVMFPSLLRRSKRTLFRSIMASDEKPESIQLACFLLPILLMFALDKIPMYENREQCSLLGP